MRKNPRSSKLSINLTARELAHAKQLASSRKLTLSNYGRAALYHQYHAQRHEAH